MGKKERLRRVQGRIQLEKVQRVKRTDLVMGAERGGRSKCMCST